MNVKGLELERIDDVNGVEKIINEQIKRIQRADPFDLSAPLDYKSLNREQQTAFWIVERLRGIMRGDGEGI